MLKRVLIICDFMLLVCCQSSAMAAGQLSWPLACVPGLTCMETRNSGIGYPDISFVDEKVNSCRAPAYRGHTGTDIYVSSVDARMPVLAAADGEIMWVTDGMFDRCQDPNQADCAAGVVPICTASAGSWDSGATLSCAGGRCNCLWGFNAGNFILVRHDDTQGIAFTMYGHLKKGSIVVARGQRVHSGEQLAEAGSSGNSVRPHLHFGVWSSAVGNLEPADPWGSGCDKEQRHSLWIADPPFMQKLAIIPSPAENLKQTTKLSTGNDK